MMLAHNYPNEVEKTQLVTDWLFILTYLNCTFVYIKRFFCNFFTVGEKAKSYQTHNQTKENKEVHVIQIILTYTRVAVGLRASLNLMLV